MKKTDESRYDWSASTLFWKHHLFSFKDDVYSMTNNSTDDNEKPTMVCYRHLTVELFFIFEKVGQWPFAVKINLTNAIELIINKHSESAA